MKGHGPLGISKPLLVTDNGLAKSEIVLKAIADAAKTGEIGDGKIFVSPIDSVVRIRTGDRNEIAL